METASRLSLSMKDVFQLIADDLDRVETRLKKRAESSLPLVNDINRYLHNSGGKRLRPALLLLSSRASGAAGDGAIDLSVVVELIHVATLVHDDVLDNADMRRGRPSVNARWGNQVTVLMGDWLYMTSFHVALQQRSFKVLDVLIDVTRKMVEGELIQLEVQARLDLSPEDQLEICRRKTGYLFSACSRMGAILGGLDVEQEDNLARYGKCLGMAFQLIDDLLDYSSSSSVLGKPVLKDLEEGKVTLPIIYLMRRADSSERLFLRQVVENRDFSPPNKDRIIELLRSYGILREVRKVAAGYAEEARKSLTGLQDSIYRDALLKVPDFVIYRDR